jgi:hypothetical protein
MFRIIILYAPPPLCKRVGGQKNKNTQTIDRIGLLLIKSIVIHQTTLRSHRQGILENF